MVLFWPCTASSDTLRIATYTLEFARKGPGLVLRDLRRGNDPQIIAALHVIAHAQADILLICGLDHDLTGATMTAFAEAIRSAGGPDYAYRFAARPNTGLRTGFDLDRNGRLGEARDAQGYGIYPGQAGLALLSRYPVMTKEAQDFSSVLWRDLPGAQLPQDNGVPFYPPAVTDILRLSSTAHWDVPIEVPGFGRLSLLAFAATTPVFDGPEDRNGLRNADEVRFWSLYLDGALPYPPPAHPVVVIGKANLDPADGDGRSDAIRSLLAHPRLQDPKPRRPFATPEPDHAGDPHLDTAEFRPASDGPGNLRVDYILPDISLRVRGSGVDWPAADDPRSVGVAAASRHRLVWVDLALSP